MSEKRFTLEQWTEESLYFSDGEYSAHMSIGYICKKVEKKLNEQSDTIEGLLLDRNRQEEKLDIARRNMTKQLEKIGEQQATINLLLDLLYQSEATVINEYSSHIGEDMDKLDKIFKEKDIKEIERFVRGCDDE